MNSKVSAKIPNGLIQKITQVNENTLDLFFIFLFVE